jgi:hypothetical protein
MILSIINASFILSTFVRFVALDRHRKIQKFSFDKFAVCIDPEALSMFMNFGMLTYQ